MMKMRSFWRISSRIAREMASRKKIFSVVTAGLPDICERFRRLRELGCVRKAERARDDIGDLVVEARLVLPVDDASPEPALQLTFDRTQRPDGREFLATPGFPSRRCVTGEAMGDAFQELRPRASPDFFRHLTSNACDQLHVHAIDGAGRHSEGRADIRD